MAKRKWYVVTVGKDIGVFSTWLEAGPLVKGVPEAIYQSFWSQQEAHQAFVREQAKGTTRVIESDQQSSPRKTPSRPNIERSIFTPGSLNSSIIVDHHGDSRHQSNRSNGSTSPSLSSLSRSRRFAVVNALFEKEAASVGVEAQASHSRYASASTPAGLTSPVRYSDQGDEPLTPPRVIVKTPSWLASYPKASPPYGLLSPLNHVDLPLNHFDDLSNQRSPARTATASTRTSNAAHSSFYSSPAHRPVTTYKSDIDPRSPIGHQSQVPELKFATPLFFERPSPSTNAKDLSLSSRRSPLKSSLLLRPNDSISE